jgi:hypothetical protein
MPFYVLIHTMENGVLRAPFILIEFFTGHVARSST